MEVRDAEAKSCVKSVTLGISIGEGIFLIVHYGSEKMDVISTDCT